MERRGILRKITLNDEQMCSSKVIFAVVEQSGGETMKIQIIRELLEDSHKNEFDQFWNTVKKSGKNSIVGKKVIMIQNNFNFESIKFY